MLVGLAREFERIERRDEVDEYVELTNMTTESRNGVMSEEVNLGELQLPVRLITDFA